jgi:hypothetical protein
LVGSAEKKSDEIGLARICTNSGSTALSNKLFAFEFREAPVLIELGRSVNATFAGFDCGFKCLHLIQRYLNHFPL